MRPKSQWIFRGLAIVVALLATVQPVLGSFSFFRPADATDYAVIHEVAGSLIFYLSVVMAVLTFFSKFHRRWAILGCCLVLFVAAQGQLALGVKSNDDAGLLAFHIPLGVFIFLLTYLIAALSFGMRLESNRA